MKTMKCTRPYLAGIFSLMSLSLISADLIALGGDARICTLPEEIPTHFSFELSDNWSSKGGQGLSEVEIVKEHKGTLLTLRSYQSNVALYNKIRSIEDEQ